MGHWEAVWWVEEEVMGSGISSCKMHTKHLSILFKMQRLAWQVWGGAKCVHFNMLPGHPRSSTGLGGRPPELWNQGLAG